MKVKDLIEKLQALPQDAMVIGSGYEGGYVELDEVDAVTIAMDIHDEWYYGPHELVHVGEGDAYGDAPRAQAVKIS